MLKLDYRFKKEILACGTPHEAGFCLTKKNCAYVVTGLGNLDEQSVLENYQHQIQSLSKELKIKPKIITHDLYTKCKFPIYDRAVVQKESDLRYIPIQHHHAHVASCMGENKLEKRAIGVVFDCSAKGTDGYLWGGEFFVGNLNNLRRIAHLKYTPISDNYQARLDSWQQASDFLYQAFGEGSKDLDIDFSRPGNMNNWQIIKENLASSFYSSSMARLFDAVAALVGLRERLDYEGQGATELERIVNRSSHVANKIYRVTLKHNKDMFLIYPESIFQDIVEDLKKNVSRSIISAAFHNTITEIIRQLCHKIKQIEKIKDVILSGSIFKNRVFFNQVKDSLNKDGFNVVTHTQFSYNDDSVSFGQAILADNQC